MRKTERRSGETDEGRQEWMSLEERKRKEDENVIKEHRSKGKYKKMIEMFYVTRKPEILSNSALF